jgi:hypothetical protein
MVATLPTGRAVWLRFDASPAPLRDVDCLAAWDEGVSTSRARALRSNSKAAVAHKQALRRDMGQASRALLRAHRHLLRRMVHGDARLDAGLDQRLVPVIDQALALQDKRDELGQSSARRGLWNQAVVMTALPLLAAFGERGSPFTQSNLVLALSVFIFLFGDEVSDLLAGKRESQIRCADVWSYAAPFANVLSVWWLLGRRQHERFITGVVDQPTARPGGKGISVFTVRSGNVQTDTCWAIVDLSPHIAPDRLADFVGQSEVVALATLRSIEANPDLPGIQPRIVRLRAQVRQDVLWVIVIVVSVVPKSRFKGDPPPLLSRLGIGWAVDSRPPSTTR